LPSTAIFARRGHASDQRPRPLGLGAISVEKDVVAAEQQQVQRLVRQQLERRVDQCRGRGRPDVDVQMNRRRMLAADGGRIASVSRTQRTRVARKYSAQSRAGQCPR
jgi:hypothetical protein